MAYIFHRFIINLAGGPQVRRATLNNRDHLVVPCVSMAEGVWEGNQGPVFYPALEFQRTLGLWNSRPLVVGHPTGPDGNHISACDPVVINTRGIGMILNTGWADKLTHEAWIDVDRCREVDARILDKIEKGEKVEVSTGLFADGELLTNEAEFGGRKYKHVARNFRPDHLAVLPDDVGAFSVAAGGGLLANALAANRADAERTVQATDRAILNALRRSGLLTNELSFNAITRQLSDLLASKYGEKGKYWPGWIDEVYPDYCIFWTPQAEANSSRDQMLMVGYKVTNDAVELTGEAKKVTRSIVYRVEGGGQLTANAGRLVPDPVTPAETSMFQKAQHIAALIANAAVTGFTEADRPFLEAKPDDWLQKYTHLPQPGQQFANAGVPAPQPAPVQQPTNNPPADPLRAFINSAPPQLRPGLEDMLAAGQRETAILVNKILACPTNVIPKETLEQTPLTNLRMMAALVPDQQTQPGTNGTIIVPGPMPFLGAGAAPQTHYAAAAGPAPMLANAAPPPSEGLPLPTMQFKNPLENTTTGRTII